MWCNILCIDHPGVSVFKFRCDFPQQWLCRYITSPHGSVGMVVLDHGISLVDVITFDEVSRGLCCENVTSTVILKCCHEVACLLLFMTN